MNLLNYIIKQYNCFIKLQCFLFLAFGLFSFQTFAQCDHGSNTFTWEGTGSGNQAVMHRLDTSATTTVSGCSEDVDVTLTLENPDNAFYSNNIDGANISGTNGSSSVPGYSMWLDGNNDLFDTTPLNLDEEASLVFTFSKPIIVNDFTVMDIDWRNLGITARWRDKVTVTAQDENGNDVPLSVVLGDPSSTINITGQTALTDYNTISGDGGLDITDLTSHVIWSSTSAIKTLKCTYFAGVANSGQQIIQIANFNFCCPPPPSIDFDGIDDYIEAPSTFSLNNMEELTIQFWAKANTASQNSAGILGQKGVLEVTKSNNLAYSFKDQGSSGSYSKSVWLDDANTWQHVTLVYEKGKIKTYYNGELENVQESAGVTKTSISSELFSVGGKIKTGSTSNYFHGWIDEVRVFDVALTDSQLQQIIYQEIENNNGNVRGAVIPKDIADFDSDAKVSWSNLKLYYRMGTDFTDDGRVIDYSGNENHGTIHNITTWQEETAPMPYETKQDGNWEDASTWLHGDVWDTASGIKFPNLGSSDITNCAIVKINHNVNLDYDNFYNTSFPVARAKQGLTQIGLFVDQGKTLTVANDKHLNNLWYLQLNGTIDLLDDSQLIQTKNSDLVTSSQGKILRRQEGNSSVYWYNYFSSPVGAMGTTVYTNNNALANNPNNTDYRINMLKKGNGGTFQFTNAHHETGKVSTRWLYTYKNGVEYWDYAALEINTPIQPGVGYTQKGTGVGSEQQYLFEGKPNNGTIVINVTDTGGAGSVPAVSKTDYLLGNPYASAIDLHKFIDDNAGIIDGTIQLWQQWSGTSHNLDLYDGGYAQVNKTGSVRAYQFIGIEGANNGNQDGTKVPTKYLPVGQGFVTEIVNSGTVVFKNSQRVFVKEADADGSYTNGSVFFRTDNTSATKSTASQENEEQGLMQKIRLEFNAVNGPATKRELLLGFSDFTTDDYDYGYDAKNIDENDDDLNLVLDDQNMMIQAYSVITADKSVPLVFKASGSYNYRIKLTQLENIEADQEIYLKDNLTGYYFDLRTDQSYEFSSEQGEFASRFELVFQEHGESLSTIDADYEFNLIYFQNETNKLFVKDLKVDAEHVMIINMLGQSVQDFTQVTAQILDNGLEISNLAAGTYVVYLKTETSVKTKKIIIN